MLSARTHGTPTNPGRATAGAALAVVTIAIAIGVGRGTITTADDDGDTDASSVVTITPARVLDTRDPTDVGLPGPFVSPVRQKLRVTGLVDTTTGPSVVVPAGATGVVLNVTAVAPTADGFVSIRPGDAAGPPATSNLNVVAGDITPNAVTVRLPTSGPDAGTIDIVFDAYGTPGPTADLLIDVVAYLLPTQPGEPGEPGSPPPTEPIGGGIARDFVPDPFPEPITPTSGTTFTTTRPSHLLVHAHAGMSINCTPQSNVWTWMSIDDVPVRSSLVILTGSGDPLRPVTTSGVTDEVIEPGEHVLRMHQRCFTGSATSISSNLPVGTFLHVTPDG